MAVARGECRGQRHIYERLALEANERNVNSAVSCCGAGDAEGKGPLKDHDVDGGA